MGQPLDLHVGAPKAHEHLRDQSRDERKCGHDDERGAGAGVRGPYTSRTSPGVLFNVNESLQTRESSIDQRGLET